MEFPDWVRVKKTYFWEDNGFKEKEHFLCFYQYVIGEINKVRIEWTLTAQSKRHKKKTKTK